MFALTFDDGPDPTWTPKVLAILKKKNAPATFFMVGEMVRAHASTGQLVVEAGHSIGGHSWHHPKRTHSPVMEIERTDAVIKSELGVTHRIFRPPYGLLKNGLARAATERGQDVILWSSDSNDWNRNTNAARIKANVLHSLTPGGIALMHDGGGNRSATVAALPNLIDAIRNRGYELVTVPEILAMGPPETVPIGNAKAKVKAKPQPKPKAKPTGKVQPKPKPKPKPNAQQTARPTAKAQPTVKARPTAQPSPQPSATNAAPTAQPGVRPTATPNAQSSADAA